MNRFWWYCCKPGERESGLGYDGNDGRGMRWFDLTDVSEMKLTELGYRW